MKIIRYESYHGFPLDERGNGYFVSQYCDIYMGYWFASASDGMHDAGGKNISYLNFSGMADVFVDGTVNPDFDPNWVLRDENGDYIYAINNPQNKAIDPMNQGFRDYLVGYIQTRLAEGFDGCWADNGIAPRFPDDFTYNTLAINPRTGTFYTDADYVRDRVSLLNYVKQVLPQALLISNGFWSGRRFYLYYDAYNYVLNNLKIDSIFSEGLFTDQDGMIWSEDEWIQSVNMVSELQNRWVNNYRIYVAYSQSRNGAVYNNISEAQMADFLYASSLMGFSKDGNAFCAHNTMDIPEIQETLKIDIGYPIVTYSKIPNTMVYTRTFTKAKIFVNLSLVESYNLEEYGIIPPLGSLFIEEKAPIEARLPIIELIISGLALFAIFKSKK